MNIIVYTDVVSWEMHVATSIEIIVEPLSRDIVPVRNQVIEVDTDTLSVISEADTFAGGSAQAGVGYTTTSGY